MAGDHKRYPRFDIAALVPVYIAADIDAALQKVKTLISLYVGRVRARTRLHLDALSGLATATGPGTSETSTCR